MFANFLNRGGTIKVNLFDITDTLGKFIIVFKLWHTIQYKGQACIFAVKEAKFCVSIFKNWIISVVKQHLKYKNNFDKETY